MLPVQKPPHTTSIPFELKLLICDYAKESIGDSIFPLCGLSAVWEHAVMTALCRVTKFPYSISRNFDHRCEPLFTPQVGDLGGYEKYVQNLEISIDEYAWTFAGLNLKFPKLIELNLYTPQMPAKFSRGFIKLNSGILKLRVECGSDDNEPSEFDSIYTRRIGALIEPLRDNLQSLVLVYCGRLQSYPTILDQLPRLTNFSMDAYTMGRYGSAEYQRTVSSATSKHSRRTKPAVYPNIRSYTLRCKDQSPPRQFYELAKIACHFPMLDELVYIIDTGLCLNDVSSNFHPQNHELLYEISQTPFQYLRKLQINIETVKSAENLFTSNNFPNLCELIISDTKIYSLYDFAKIMEVIMTGNSCRSDANDEYNNISTTNTASQRNTTSHLPNLKRFKVDAADIGETKINSWDAVFGYTYRSNSEHGIIFDPSNIIQCRWASSIKRLTLSMNFTPQVLIALEQFINLEFLSILLVKDNTNTNIAAHLTTDIDNQTQEFRKIYLHGKSISFPNLIAFEPIFLYKDVNLATKMLRCLLPLFPNLKVCSVSKSRFINKHDFRLLHLSDNTMFI
ncbi:hypothetical protein H4219_002555 [Mycoemilia scoparia]|uniref:F-box domain-containing protein n=1 Tax=Mycoemilia scoparia TaxID=417184 RepID=A0A9W8A6N2_9FUNG|nr:hypothetical protein H4219_002555 [Mycoemilia scoparia]